MLTKGSEKHRPSPRAAAFGIRRLKARLSKNVPKMVGGGKDKSLSNGEETGKEKTGRKMAHKKTTRHQHPQPTHPKKNQRKRRSARR